MTLLLHDEVQLRPECGSSMHAGKVGTVKVINHESDTVTVEFGPGLYGTYSPRQLLKGRIIEGLARICFASDDMGTDCAQLLHATGETITVPASIVQGACSYPEQVDLLEPVFRKYQYKRLRVTIEVLDPEPSPYYIERCDITHLYLVLDNRDDERPAIDNCKTYQEALEVVCELEGS